MQIMVEAKFIANEASPISKIRPINFPLGTKPEILSLKALFLLNTKNQITKIAPAPCPKIVARPLPITPILNLRTNNQLSAMQTITLTTLVRRANLGAPAVRIKLFIPIPTDKKINPKH